MSNPSSDTGATGNTGHHNRADLALPEHDFPSPEDLHAFLGGVLDHHDYTPSSYHHESFSQNTNGDVGSGLNLSSGITGTFDLERDQALHMSSDAAELCTLRMSEDGDDGKGVDRTERKRCREKQRRVDTNKQFSELTACLRQVESEFDSEELRSAALPSVFSPSNRADLLARTAALMNALHQCCKRRKVEVETLRVDLENAKKAGEEAAAKLKENIMAPQNMGGNKVMMMVPMMIGGDGQTGMMPMMNPWGMSMPQTYMPMPSAHTLPVANVADCRNDVVNNSIQGKQASSDAHSNSSHAFSEKSESSPMNFISNNGTVSMAAMQGMPWSMPSGPSMSMPFSVQQFQPTMGNIPGYGQTPSHQVVKTDNNGNSNTIESNLAHCA